MLSTDAITITCYPCTFQTIDTKQYIIPTTKPLMVGLDSQRKMHPLGTFDNSRPLNPNGNHIILVDDLDVNNWILPPDFDVASIPQMNKSVLNMLADILPNYRRKQEVLMQSFSQFLEHAGLSVWFENKKTTFTELLQEDLKKKGPISPRIVDSMIHRKKYYKRELKYRNSELQNPATQQLIQKQTICNLANYMAQGSLVQELNVAYIPIWHHERKDMTLGGAQFPVVLPDAISTW